MKVLLIGKNSYIGTSFIKRFGDKYDICEYDSLNGVNKEIYIGYDVVIHLAGIAHVSSKKSMESLYYKVNRDLAIESCKLAKLAGCKQFIFMSSMIIYGDDDRIGKKKIINRDTTPAPSNFYGQSKLDADEYISSQNSEDFKTLVIRTPMVYGEHSKGNYPKMLSLALKLPFVPNIENKRSVIEINNLCSFFNSSISSGFNGIYFPQDPEYMCSSKVMSEHRIKNNKKPRLTKFFNPLIYLASLFIGQFNKLFGTKIYDIGEVHEDGVKY